jgi:hypothetical protein
MQHTEPLLVEDSEFIKSNGFIVPLRSARTSAEETTAVLENPSTLFVSGFGASVLVWACFLMKTSKLETIQKSDKIYVPLGLPGSSTLGDKATHTVEPTVQAWSAMFYIAANLSFSTGIACQQCTPFEFLLFVWCNSVSSSRLVQIRSHHGDQLAGKLSTR